MSSSTCKQIKSFCLEHEWAQSLFATMGVGLMVATSWFILQMHSVILVWLMQDILIHGLAFVIAIIGDIALMFTFMSLGFSDCNEEDKNCWFAYRGRRSNIHPETLNWLGSLGSNPKRRKEDRL